MEKIIAIVGPTASGKTGLLLELAREIEAEVIAADSRTIYRGMDIGTAKPEGEKKSWSDAAMKAKSQEVNEQISLNPHSSLRRTSLPIDLLFEEKPLVVEGIDHWGFDLVDPNQPFTTADFQQYVFKKADEILAREHVPMLVGGTGLYVKAVVDNLTFADTQPDPELRQELDALTNEELIEQIAELDSEAVETIDTANRRRLLRALEILKTTGKPLSQQQRQGPPKYEVLQIGVKVEREVLNERINTRVDQMIADGLVDEVRALKEQYGSDVNAMTGIGYRQICAFLDGYMKLADAIELIKRDTRHYAKRQMTWFKRDERIVWCETIDEARKAVQNFL